MSLEAEVLETLERYALLHGVRRVVVAVSGGADSTALIHVLAALRAELSVDLHAAHLDHGWRVEAAADRAAVTTMAERLGVPLTCGVAPLGRPTGGGGREARARAARSAFLEQVARDLGAERIATGHTRDDQAETVLLRLLRGAGSRGLAGIPPARLPYIRPLIATRRATILAWLRAQGIAWQEDRTNADLSLTRNRVRLDLLPRLEAGFGPGVTERIAGLADLLRDDEECLDRTALEAFADLASRGSAGMALDRPGLAARPAAIRRRVLRHACREVRGGEFFPSRAVIAQLERLLEGGAPGPIHLAAGVEAATDGVQLLLRRPAASCDPGFHAPCRVPGKVAWPEADIYLTLQEVDRCSLGTDITQARPGVAFLDGERAGAELELRSRRPGDAFFPLGLGGRKKLQDFLVDARVPRGQRDRVGLLTSQGEVAWVVGHRIDERFRVTDATRRVLVVARGER
jgi:tRNA(Ile)-lysidine synthase